MNNIKLISTVGGGLLGLMISVFYSWNNSADLFSAFIKFIPIGLLLGFCMGTFLMYMKKKKSYNSAPEKQEVTEESVAKETPKESMPEPIPMENATAAIPETPVADLNPVIDNEETDSIIEIHREGRFAHIGPFQYGRTITECNPRIQIRHGCREITRCPFTSYNRFGNTHKLPPIIK